MGWDVGQMGCVVLVGSAMILDGTTRDKCECKPVALATLRSLREMHAPRHVRVVSQLLIENWQLSRRRSRVSLHELCWVWDFGFAVLEVLSFCLHLHRHGVWQALKHQSCMLLGG